MHRYDIFGAGGVGSLLGGRLALAGERVALVGRPRHVERIAAVGLRIVECDGAVTTVRLAASETPPAPELGDIVVLTVKSYDTPAALAALRRVYDRATPIICLQNGVRNEPRARRAFRRVYAGLNLIGAQHLTPGEVEALGPMALAIGVYPRGADALAEEVAAAASRAGVSATVHANPMAAKWTKLAMNCHNAVFALCDSTVAATLNDPDGAALIQRIREEARAALTAAGIEHEPIADVGPPGAMPTPPVPMYGSTWMDFKLGRGKHEADSFNGEIVRLGRRHGVPTPANALLLRLTRSAARRRRPPGGFTLAELRRRAASNGADGSQDARHPAAAAGGDPE
jgi:2-dehydropantoate 2-reductase